MPAPMPPYRSMGIDFYHRKYWQRSVVGSRGGSKWKWLTSWQSGDCLHVHARLVSRWISMRPLYLYYYKCACWAFDAACGRYNKCMNTKWWSQCRAIGNQLKRGISLWICHPFWVLYMKMSLRPGPMCPKHPTTAGSWLKMQRTIRKTIASQWCAVDKCVRTDDDGRSECIWKGIEKIDEIWSVWNHSEFLVIPKDLTCSEWFRPCSAD